MATVAVLMGGVLLAGSATAFDGDLGSIKVRFATVVESEELVGRVECVFTTKTGVHWKVRKRKQRQLILKQGNRQLFHQAFNYGPEVPEGHAGPDWTAGEQLIWGADDTQAYADPNVSNREYRCEIVYDIFGGWAGGGKIWYSTGRRSHRDGTLNVALPSPPSNFRIEDELATRDRVTVRWDERTVPSGALAAEGYTLQRNVADGGWQSLRYLDGSDSTRFVDSQPFAGSVRYRIRTESMASHHRDLPEAARRYGDWRELTATITPVADLPAPAELAVTEDSNGYSLEWIPVPHAERRYLINEYMARVWDARSGEIIHDSITVGGNEQRIVVPLAPGKNLRVRVRANRRGGESSDPVELTFGTPTAPTLLAATGADRHLALRWEPPASIDLSDYPITGWRARYRRTGNSTWLSSSDFGSFDTREQKVGVDLDTSGDYEVQLAAVNRAGISVWSNSISSVNITTAARSADTGTATLDGRTITGPIRVQPGDTVTYTVRHNGRSGDTERIGIASQNYLVSRRFEDRSEDPTVQLGFSESCRLTDAPAIQFTIACLYIPDGASTQRRGSPGQEGSNPPTAVRYRTGATIPDGHEMKVYVNSYSSALERSILVGWSPSISTGQRSLHWFNSTDSSRYFEVTVAPVIDRPTPPLHPQVRRDGGDWVVTWEPPLNDRLVFVTHYEVERQRNGGDFMDQEEIDVANEGLESRYSTTEAAVFGWRVRARRATVESDPTDHISEYSETVTAGALLAPYITTTLPGDGVVELTWIPRSGEHQVPVTKYSIEQSTTGTGNWTTVADNLAVAATTRRISGLTNGSTYYFRVNAHGSMTMHDSPSSNRVAVTPDPTLAVAPDEPAGLQVTTGETAFTLTWQEPAYDGRSTISGYQVEATADPDGEWTPLTVTIDGTARTHDIPFNTFATTTVEFRTQAYFRMRAANVAGAGAATTASAATVPEPTAPQTPVAQAQDRENVIIAWEAPDAASQTVNLTGYRVERSADGTTGWTDVGETDADTTWIRGTGHQAGETWHYRVRARNEYGWEGTDSTVVPIATIAADAPDAPNRLLVSASSAGDVFTLSWSPPAGNPSGITHYQAQRASDDDVIWTNIQVNIDRSSRAADLRISGASDTSHRFRLAAINSSGGGLWATEFVPTAADQERFAAADINGDDAIDADDAEYLYLMLAFPELLDPVTGIASMRHSIILTLLGLEPPDETASQALINTTQPLAVKARQWRDDGLQAYGDLNRNGRIDADDALILSHVHTLESELGTGASDSGTAAMRQAFLAPLAGDINIREDAELRGLILRARLIAIPESP